jgi:hypothetical protein
MVKESDRLGECFRIARAEAEKKHGEWILAPKRGEWPGEAIVSPFYDRWNRATRAERKAAMRMARTPPTSHGGMAAMISHARRALKTDGEVDWRDWALLALKTAASALVRMDAA